MFHHEGREVLEGQGRLPILRVLLIFVVEKSFVVKAGGKAAWSA